MPARSRHLLLLPLLLLVPLGVLKWRADHSPESAADHAPLTKVDKVTTSAAPAQAKPTPVPQPTPLPLSAMDKKLRADIGKASEMVIFDLKPRWGQRLGIADSHYLLIKDQAVLRQIVETLRCTEETAPIRFYQPDALDTGDIRFMTRTGYHQAIGDYWHESSHCYVALADDKDFRMDMDLGPRRRTVVRPNFAPRFEALLTRLARRARAKGHHPDVAILPYPFR